MRSIDFFEFASVRREPIVLSLGEYTGLFHHQHYVWDGPEDAPVFIDLDWITKIDPSVCIQGKKVNGLPWPVQIVHYSPNHGAFLCIRTDGWKAVSSRLWEARYRAWRVVNLCQKRLLLTLFLWNLADVKPGTIPSWSDVKRPECPAWLRRRKKEEGRA